MQSCFLFPGQGISLAAAPKLLSKFPLIKKTYDEASHILKIDLYKMGITGQYPLLYSQPLIVTHCFAIWKQVYNRIKESSIQSDEVGEMRKKQIFIGHSLGEITALVSSNCIDFESALKLTVIFDCLATSIRC